MTTVEQTMPTNTAAFSLLKHLLIPICVRIGTLQLALPFRPVPNSEKYKNPTVFQKLSRTLANLDLFVVVEVYDGNGNMVGCPVQTPYRPFSGNRRLWDCYLKLPLNYNQCGYDEYLRMVLYEVVNCRPEQFAVGRLLLFNHTNGALRKGAQKVGVYWEERGTEYGDHVCGHVLEELLMQYRNGEMARNAWLDPLVVPEAERAQGVLDDAPFHLYVDLPNFLLPVVFSEISYSRRLPEISEDIQPAPPAQQPLVSSHIDIPVPARRVWDPDFDIHTVVLFRELAADPMLAPPKTATELLNPVERKFNLLATSINNNWLLDKEVKPLPATRDELWRILRKPLSAPLSDHEKRMLWKFRFYFSKPQSSEDSQAAPSQVTRLFLTKFLKCFNWENEYELDHAFNEILPFWKEETIEIGDALELLSNQFNPYNLTLQLRRRAVAQSKDTSEEHKIDKIFAYAMELRRFAVKRLQLASPDELLLYLLQLVQALKYEDGDNNLEQAPLSQFLIDKAVHNGVLGNFFYWFVKVENEDQLQKGGLPKLVNNAIFGKVLNTYIERLRVHCKNTKSKEYKYLKRQIAFIKKLTLLVETIRTTFRRNEATEKKRQFLKEYLADPANEMLDFPELFPLPLDPTVKITGTVPLECSVFKLSLLPLKITFKTTAKTTYPLMFKIGDDLRQDQLVIQIINLMDQLLKNENLDMKLTPYKILATSPQAGLIQFVENVTLDSVLLEDPLPVNGILKYLQNHLRQQQPQNGPTHSVLGQTRNSAPVQQHSITLDLGISTAIMDNYVKLCAGYCVITYLLGVGDRHLDNLLVSPDGRFWHADFGYILGRDPKPFPPLMKLPIQMIDGMGGMTHENFNIFKNYCFITYTTLRRNSNLILNLFQLMLDALIPDIQIDPNRTVDKVQEKFALGMLEEEAILHFQNLIIDSVNAFLPMVIDALHLLAQYWRA